MWQGGSLSAGPETERSDGARVLAIAPFSWLAAKSAGEGDITN